MKLFDFKLISVVTLCICSRHVTPYHVHMSVFVFQFVLCVHESPFVALYKSTRDFRNTCGATCPRHGENIVLTKNITTVNEESNTKDFMVLDYCYACTVSNA